MASGAVVADSQINECCHLESCFVRWSHLVTKLVVFTSMPNVSSKHMAVSQGLRTAGSTNQHTLQWLFYHVSGWWVVQPAYPVSFVHRTLTPIQINDTNPVTRYFYYFWGVMSRHVLYDWLKSQCTFELLPLGHHAILSRAFPSIAIPRNFPSVGRDCHRCQGIKWPRLGSEVQGLWVPSRKTLAKKNWQFTT